MSYDADDNDVIMASIVPYNQSESQLTIGKSGKQECSSCISHESSIRTLQKESRRQVREVQGLKGLVLKLNEGFLRNFMKDQTDSNKSDTEREKDSEVMFYKYMESLVSGNTG
eukprot:CAMPEP_0119047398 /NCGR_PEP_ID=MMETSP1177-20130426/52938_1 /TAXON_ID=2985 /ORGANISM="Ochromonas sp, Strain CCMP1899" /LENGTH=112 /DNA_ID=CAMNT_0007021949 /DNA_START=284 /DNA_END=618 /DNA_ORIENTATION=-